MSTQEDEEEEYEQYAQPDINKGQRKINGRLCEVDEQTLTALDKLLDLLSDVPGFGNKVNFDELKRQIQTNLKRSKSVAEIKPPGCDYSTWP